MSSFSEGENKETERCCWKHQQCPVHIIHSFSDCGHHNRCMHAVSHCNCESRCQSYRPISVAIFHHPTHHMYMTDDLNDLEANQLAITNNLCSTDRPTDPNSVESTTGAPDLSAPITIWRSASPIDKCQEGKVIKNIKKKKKEKDKEEMMVDEKPKLKKKAKGKLIKKKSPMKSESSPADLSHSISPRELVRTSESSPDSREGLESEDSYERGKERPSSEDIVESSPKKKEKCSAQAKKNATKNLQTRKTSKRKSPPVPNPNLS
ncbi:protein PROCA1 isoform X2 [Rattus norvegicus]|nr:protein PROCA1 isoform X2 [Rattus norvegicus]XP_038942537.1 protein PROCA1 isoform X2 [Rattus norvegicus]XP_038942538.1 protein PROCA1 isoform X2 [Rattus norvegicus]XP_038942539.1 protein PROCA1 isoform X2 [Rattus norvegicus]XP_038942540.1 protein PROCA1 isoform X2 [Rattus norvegicus]